MITRTEIYRNTFVQGRDVDSIPAVTLAVEDATEMEAHGWLVRQVASNFGSYDSAVVVVYERYLD